MSGEFSIAVPIGIKADIDANGITMVWASPLRLSIDCRISTPHNLGEQHGSIITDFVGRRPILNSSVQLTASYVIAWPAVHRTLLYRILTLARVGCCFPITGAQAGIDNTGDIIIVPIFKEDIASTPHVMSFIVNWAHADSHNAHLPRQWLQNNDRYHHLLTSANDIERHCLCNIRKLLTEIITQRILPPSAHRRDDLINFINKPSVVTSICDHFVMLVTSWDAVTNTYIHTSVRYGASAHTSQLMFACMLMVGHIASHGSASYFPHRDVGALINAEPTWSRPINSFIRSFLLIPVKPGIIQDIFDVWSTFRESPPGPTLPEPNLDDIFGITRPRTSSPRRTPRARSRSHERRASAAGTPSTERYETDIFADPSPRPAGPILEDPLSGISNDGEQFESSSLSFNRSNPADLIRDDDISAYS